MLGFISGMPQNPAKLPACDLLVPLPDTLVTSVCAQRSPIVLPRRTTTVTHITLSKTANAKPYLEFHSDGSGKARRVTIESSPFRIGRAESAHLRVDSVEISREHAEIFERNGAWLVRDLGSTNGTHVNGEPIKETLLADGDILTLAEIELTFISSTASQFQRMVTRPVQSKRLAPARCALPLEVAAARMITEATLWQAIPSRLLSAISLRDGVTEALFSPATSCKKHQTVFDQPHAVGNRYRELERMRALELAKERTDAARLFLAVGLAEVESPHRLFAHLEQLQELLPIGWELGITISMPPEVDIVRITDVYRGAREQELLVAFDEFQGNGVHVMHLQSLVPDYLVLAPSMMKDLASAQHPQRRLESLLAACAKLAIKPVLPRDDSDETVRCQEIGYDLVLSTATDIARSPFVESSLSV
jgi:hypothetical protein